MPRFGGAYVDSLKQEITMHFEDDDNWEQAQAEEQMHELALACNKFALDINEISEQLQVAADFSERWMLDDARYMLRLQRAFLDKIIAEMEQKIGGYQ